MKRENRYLVLKRSDIARYLGFSDQAMLLSLAESIADFRTGEGRIDLECVVVEADWPEYEPTWAAIEARVDAEASAKGDNKHYCSDGYWWEITGSLKHACCVTFGVYDDVLESEVFSYRGAAYKQKNKWLTKYNMFCPD